MSDQDSFPGRDRNCSHHCVQIDSGKLTASYPNGTGAKDARCETDPSSPSSAAVKNACSDSYTLPYVFMAWCLFKFMGIGSLRFSTDIVNKA
jgi:hypothetical protein